MSELTQTAEATRVDPVGHASAPYLLMVDHPEPHVVGASREIVDGASLLLGRASDSALPGAFDDGLTSRRHATLSRSGEMLTVTDLGSRNGTFVNGERISGPTTLARSDVLTLGNTVLTVVWAAEPPTPCGLPDTVGMSPSMSLVQREITTAAKRDVTVFVLGETGTGKELAARAVHVFSGRDGPWVALNCAGVSDALLASALFGHVKGAFTGAHERRRGLLETARGGTLLLDEVADASPAFQASLLRLLETRMFRPLGSDREQTCDIRFVAACQPAVRQAVDAGGFRPDLWARLAQWVVELPPLRERPEDVPMLARAAARRIAGRQLSLAPRLSVRLMRHDWPFNVRELNAVIHRAVAEATGDLLDLTPSLEKLLAPERAPDAHQRSPPAPNEAPDWQVQRRRTRPSREELVAVLTARGGNMSGVAKSLGVSRKTVYRWMEALSIRPEAFRDE